MKKRTHSHRKIIFVKSAISIALLTTFSTFYSYSKETVVAESATESLLNHFSTNIFIDPTDEEMPIDDVGGPNIGLNQNLRPTSNHFDGLIDSNFWKNTKYSDNFNSISYLGFNLGSAYSASGNSLFPMIEKSYNNSIPYLGSLPLPSYMSIGAYFALQVTPISNQIYNEVNTFGFRMIFKY